MCLLYSPATAEYPLEAQPTVLTAKCNIPTLLRPMQDKYLQKQHFKAAQVPLGDFLEVADAQQAQQAGDLFGFPLMLKSRRLAYDGKGNAVVQSSENLENAVQQLGGYKHGLYAEKWTKFVKVCFASAWHRLS